MVLDALCEEIIRLGPWHHDIEIAPGLWTGQVTQGVRYDAKLGTPSLVRPSRSMSALVAELFPSGLAGRTLLDCACNGGGYLFAAAANGAAGGFGFDAREHWIQQARFVAQHVQSAGLQFATLPLQSLPTLQLGKFDITLFSGILYHLPDPISGLRIAADLTKELLLLNTALQPGSGDALVLNRESEVEMMSGVNGLAWMPTSERVLRELLGWCGFPHVRRRYSAIDKTRRTVRIELLAARDLSTFAEWDRRHADQPVASWKARLFGRFA